MGLKVIITTMIVVMTILEIQSRRLNRDNTKKFKKRAVIRHVCDNAVRDQIIHTDNGDIKCHRPSNQELHNKINTVGGLNRHYFANSLKEARKDFRNMFKVYGKLLDNTTQWQNWVHNKPISSPYVDILKTSTSTSTSTNTQSLQPVVKREVESTVNDELKVEKRQNPGNISIQCLPGGRDTAKGVHLCPACQRCTELPQNYYPRFVNELTCDDSFNGTSENETRCALGTGPIGIPFKIGTCQQVTMVFDVLAHQPGQYVKTFENASYVEYTEVYAPKPYEVRTFCECMAKSIFKIE